MTIAPPDAARPAVRAPVHKHPPAPEFDRDAVLAKLFALPTPAHPSGSGPGRYKGGKPYPTHTPLGRLMLIKQLQIRDVLRWEGAPNDRVMTELLAGRREVGTYRAALAAGLGVDARIL